MRLEPFKRQSIYGWSIVILLVGLALCFVVWITAPAVRWQVTAPDHRPTLDNNPLPDKWTWTGVILSDIGTLLGIGYLASGVIVQLLTVFTEEGIEQPALFGKKIIFWQSVQEIRNVTTANIEINDGLTKVYLNPNIFTDAYALISELRLRVPSSAFPSQEQVFREMVKQKRSDAVRGVIGAILVGLVVFAFGKGNIRFVFGLLTVGWGTFEVWRWVKFGRYL